MLANQTKARQTILFSGLVFDNPGGFLLSHTVARAVPSAPRGLTSVFGMGTGVTLATQPPENYNFRGQGSELSYHIRIRVSTGRPCLKY